MTQQQRDNDTAYVFPGQGSQALGMGQAWAEQSSAARGVFEIADDVLDFSLSALCWEGPAEELALTANLQPALLTASVAILRGAEAEGLPQAAAVAGHSLGEYTALVAAGAIGFEDALRLVRRRGELMQAAVPVGSGAMAAILAMDDAEIDILVADAVLEGEVLSVANRNAPGQTVLAGHKGSVENAVALSKERRAKPRMLPVSAPFHCPMMAPARAGLTPDLEAVAFADPQVPVYSNVDAAPVTTGAVARDGLIRQIDGTVRWVESIARLVDEAGIRRFVEIGPGKVLVNAIKRIRPETERFNLATPEDLAALLGDS